MIEIMVVVAILTGFMIAVMAELVRVNLNSRLDSYNGSSFLQPVYDAVKISLKIDKPHIMVRIAVVFKIIIMLIIISFLPVLFSYPAIEPRYHYVLIILLLMAQPVLDLSIDRIKRDDNGHYSWISYGRNNLILINLLGRVY